MTKIKNASSHATSHSLSPSQDLFQAFVRLTHILHLSNYKLRLITTYQPPDHPLLHFTLCSKTFVKLIPRRLIPLASWFLRKRCLHLTISHIGLSVNITTLAATVQPITKPTSSYHNATRSSFFAAYRI